jgi:hypothetical protein
MTLKKVEEPDWDAIRKLTPEQRRVNFDRRRAELAAQAVANGEVADAAGRQQIGGESGDTAFTR